MFQGVQNLNLENLNSFEEDDDDPTHQNDILFNFCPGTVSNKTGNFVKGEVRRIRSKNVGIFNLASRERK